MNYKLLCFLLLSSILMFNISYLKAEENVLSISGAHFKSFDQVFYSSSDGCFSGANFSNVDLSVGSLITQLDFYVFSEQENAEVRINLHQQDAFQTFGLIIDEDIVLTDGYNLNQIVLQNRYLVKQEDVLALSFRESVASDLRICGVRVYYLEDEFIFNNGFE